MFHPSAADQTVPQRLEANGGGIEEAYVVDHRLMQDNADATGGGDDRPSSSPTSSPATDPFTKVEQELEPFAKFGYVILAVVILTALCCLWRCCKRRRERREMALESARADNVLGDMAMVPQYDSHDEDEDGELI